MYYVYQESLGGDPELIKTFKTLEECLKSEDEETEYLIENFPEVFEDNPLKRDVEFDFWKQENVVYTRPLKKYKMHRIIGHPVSYMDGSMRYIVEEKLKEYYT